MTLVFFVSFLLQCQAVSNASTSLAEDADVLFLLKAAITSDPLNVTRYWKPIGKRQRVNPCRPWVGITCTRRRVTAINLHNQSLGGTIPAALGRLAALKTLSLSTNHFSGPIPPELTSASSLETLDLGHNNLTGSLPSSIGNLLNIQTLSFSENHLSGPFPAEMASLLSLETLDLSNNNLTGALPVSFQGLKNLTVLHLQNNLLEGDFLSRVPTFSALEDLDVTNNRLNGSIPGEIGAVPLQMGLLLGGNFLNGSIPDGLGELELVKRIDLSENRLSGGVPSSIQKCISLEELNVAGNGLSGGFSVADGTLPGLATLNVSHNFLNGSLPSLSHLGNLTVFDGSFNSFSGGVASTFVSFTSLQWLNVSSNRLSGEVPFFVVHGNVTERSFLNNSGLCGEVLGVGCGHGGKLATRTVVYIAVGSAGGLVLVVLVVCFLVTYCRGWNKGSRRSAQVSAELQLKLTPEEVLAATRGFSEASFIGEGKLSAVYRGVLADETVVAVKRLVISSNVPGKEEKALDAELEALGHIRHRSLVKVLGYCAGAEAKALVLEYMPHGSLAGLLYSPQNAELNRAFDWTIRFKIAVEIAEGLKYLHAESRHPVVHGDVKPSNVLFDAKMEAKVADFGVKRIVAEQGFSPAPSPSTPVTAAHGYTPSGEHHTIWLCKRCKLFSNGRC
jgi:LRR receptor-like serine/threonine-protein kinase FLS2